MAYRDFDLGAYEPGEDLEDDELEFDPPDPFDEEDEDWPQDDDVPDDLDDEDDGA